MKKIKYFFIVLIAVVGFIGFSSNFQVSANSVRYTMPNKFIGKWKTKNGKDKIIISKHSVKLNGSKMVLTKKVSKMMKHNKVAFFVHKIDKHYYEVAPSQMSGGFDLRKVSKNHLRYKTLKSFGPETYNYKNYYRY